MSQKMGGDDNTVAFLATLGAATSTQELMTIDEDGNEVGALVIDPAKPSDQATIDDDFKLARDNIVTMTSVATSAIEKLAGIADQSQHPRAFEVLGSLIKTVLDAQQDILALHKKREDLKPGSVKKGEGETADNVAGNKVTNNLFVGTPAQLQAAIQGMKKE